VEHRKGEAQQTRLQDSDLKLGILPTAKFRLKTSMSSSLFNMIKVYPLTRRESLARKMARVAKNISPLCVDVKLVNNDLKSILDVIIRRKTSELVALLIPEAELLIEQVLGLTEQATCTLAFIQGRAILTKQINVIATAIYTQHVMLRWQLGPIIVRLKKPGLRKALTRRLIRLRAIDDVLFSTLKPVSVESIKSRLDNLESQNPVFDFSKVQRAERQVREHLIRRAKYWRRHRIGKRPRKQVVPISKIDVRRVKLSFWPRLYERKALTGMSRRRLSIRVQRLRRIRMTRRRTLKRRKSGTSQDEQERSVTDIVKGWLVGI
jgi:hypothetical protein